MSNAIATSDIAALLEQWLAHDSGRSITQAPDLLAQTRSMISRVHSMDSLPDVPRAFDRLHEQVFYGLRTLEEAISQADTPDDVSQLWAEWRAHDMPDALARGIGIAECPPTPLLLHLIDMTQ